MAAPPSFIKQWSTTPASNGTSPNVVPYGWPEGMAPSTVNDTARQQMADHRYQWQDAEWFCWGDSVSKVSGTVFKIATDVTARYLAERRIKIYDTATMYATILSSSYSAPDTSITVQFDNSENSISASFSAVALGIITPTNQSIPRNLATGTGSRNLVIGGNFDTNPWQRQVTFTSVATTTVTADRFVWYQLTTPGVVDIKKTADAPSVAQCGFVASNCLHIDVTTADAAVAAGDYGAIGYHLEGYDFAHIAQRTFTLSFWHKHTKTGVYCVAFRNQAQNRSYVAEYTQDTADTWEYATITLTGDTSGVWLYTNGIGMGIFFSMIMGSTYQTTAGSWQAGNYLATSNQVNAMDSTSNNMKFALIKLEPGTVATSYPPESEAEILAKCQRYYEKSYTQGIYPGTTSATGVLVGHAISTAVSAANQFYVGHKVVKRTIPTSIIYSYTLGTAARVSQDDASDLAVSQSFNGDAGFIASWTNGVGRYQGAFHYVADAEMIS